MPAEEQKLIDAAIAGDSSAFERLIEPLEGRIYAVALPVSYTHLRAHET